MENTKLILIFGLILLFGLQCCTAKGVTREQMWQAGKLVRESCQPKFPAVTDAIADAMKSGIFPDDKDAKCYVHCIADTMQMMKKSKFNYEGAVKQADMLLPDELHGDVLTGLNYCRDHADLWKGMKNKCDIANEIVKCLSANSPNKSFQFPLKDYSKEL